MQHLWAPWRMEFINAPKPQGCFFCEAAEPDQQRDRERFVLARTELCLALLNIYPYNNGHLMVAPRAHLPTLASLPSTVACDLTSLTQRALRVLESVLTPDGFNLGINQGKVAGAGVADHVHQHVVPRWAGDTNFMPVVGETKVLAEHLTRSYEKLRPAFDQIS
jgi:ATP adenylyltransferase